MIVAEKKGDILKATEKYVAFAVNSNGINDTGVAGRFFLKYPNLALKFPMFQKIPLGAHPYETPSGQVLLLLVAHTLGELWDHAKTQRAIYDLKDITEPIAIVKIGTGIVGQITNADWSKIKGMLERSPAKFVIYTL